MAARWRVLAIYSAWNGLMQFEWLRFAPITDSVASQYGISAADVGVLSLVFPVLFLPLALPSGWLIDRTSIQFSLRLTAILMTLGVILRVATPSFAALVAGQAVLALVQPLVMALVSKLVMVWFDDEEQLTATGLGTLSIFVGLALAFLLVPPTADAPLRSSLTFDAAVFSVLALATFLAIPHDVARGVAKPADGTTQIGWLRGTLALLKTPPFGAILGVIFLANGYSNAVFTWLEPMLQPQGISAERAGLAGLLILAGGIVGMTLLPRVPRIETHLRGLMLAIIPVGIAVTFVLLRSPDFGVVAVASFLVGVFLLSLLPIFVDVVGRIGGTSLAGTAVSTFWLAGNAGSAAAIWWVSLATDGDHWPRATYVLAGLLVAEFAVTALFFRIPKSLLEPQ